MARRKLTADEMAAKVAKMKATKAANKAAALEKLDLARKPKGPVKKARKKRVMTPEQKKAAADRLAAARAAKGPSQNKMIAENVRMLPDDNPLSLKNVREWIKENKELRQSIRSFKDSKDAKEREQFQRVDTYVTNLEIYLRSGVYQDFFYGPRMEKKISHKVWVMAYHKDGTPKRTVGWYYPDIGLYTKEMADAND